MAGEKVISREITTTEFNCHMLSTSARLDKEKLLIGPENRRKRISVFVNCFLLFRDTEGGVRGRGRRGRGKKGETRGRDGEERVVGGGVR